MHTNNCFFALIPRRTIFRLSLFHGWLKLIFHHYSCLHAAVYKFRWLQPEAARGDESDSVSLAPPQNCSHVDPVVDPRLQLFSNFCIMMVFKLFCWRLCMRSEPHCGALGDFWMRVCSRDWWERMVLKRARWWRAERKHVFSNEEKMCTMMERTVRSQDEMMPVGIVLCVARRRPPPKTWLISADPTWLHWKMLKFGKTKKAQKLKHVLYIACIITHSEILCACRRAESRTSMKSHIQSWFRARAGIPILLTQQFPHTYLNSDLQMNIIKAQSQNMTALQVMRLLALVALLGK